MRVINITLDVYNIVLGFIVLLDKKTKLLNCRKIFNIFYTFVVKGIEVPEK